MPAEIGGSYVDMVSALLTVFGAIKGGQWGVDRWNRRNSNGNGNGGENGHANGNGKVTTHQAVENLKSALVPFMEKISSNGDQEIDLLEEIRDAMTYQRGVEKGKREAREELYRKRMDEARKRGE